MGGPDGSKPWSTTLPGSKVMAVDPKRVRVTIFGSKTGTKESFHPAGEVLALTPIWMTPIWASEVLGLQLKGPKITQTAAACKDSDRWFVQELREPVSGEVTPTVVARGLAFRGGRFLYAFSAPAQRWDVVELKPAAEDKYPFTTITNECAVVTEGDTVHIFNFETGLWKSSSLGDDQ